MARSALRPLVGSFTRSLTVLGLLGLCAWVVPLPGCGNEQGNSEGDGGTTRRDRQAGQDGSGGTDRTGGTDGGQDRGAADGEDPGDATTDAAGDGSGGDGLPAPDGPVGDAGTGSPCEPETSSCGPGLRCCPSCCVSSEATFSCMAADPDGECPGPDLSVDRARLEDPQRLQLVQLSFAADACEIVEGCIPEPGVRRVLRFDTTTPNTGTLPMMLGNPYNEPNNPLFEYSDCHGHFHFKGYAQYRLLDATGTAVVTGRKQAFCLIDFEQWSANPPPNPEPFGCGANQSQGIHVGWADTYYRELPCQWIDVTDVPPGDYTLEVHVNPERLLVEKNYDNNITTIPVHIDAPAPPNPIGDCAQTLSGEERECGFVKAGFDNCTPGATIAVGCNAAAGCGLGSCQGDPILRVCDGATNNGVCLFNEALAHNDDACDPSPGGGPNHNTCPYTTFTCPASGMYSVLTAAFRSDQQYRCFLQSNP